MTTTTDYNPPARHLSSQRLSLVGLSSLALVVAACGGGGGDGGGSGGGAGQAPADNSAPSVTADERMLGNAAGQVTLSASGSDPDGDGLTYRWEQIGGAAVSDPAGFDTATASFDAPDEVDTLQFSVTVSDGVASASTQVSVIVLEDVDTAVFVNGGFSGTEDGSIDAPYASLLDAIESSPSDSDFYVQTLADDESYDVTLDNAFRSVTLEGGQSLYGAYDENWQRDVNTNKTGVLGGVEVFSYEDIDSPTTVSGFTIVSSFVTQSTSGQTVSALKVRNGSSTMRVWDNVLVAADAETGNVSNRYGSSIALSLVDVDSVDVSRNMLTAGAGGHAIDQSGRSDGVGADGVDGLDGGRDGNESSGTGGQGPAGYNGGNGGRGGTSGDQAGFAGDQGAGRASSPTASGGSGGAGGNEDVFPDENGRSGADGQDAFPNGVAGDGATGAGSVSSSGFTVSGGEQGSEGYWGAGGGGGGGGQAALFGGDGGGGGGGGEGGRGGAGGFGARSGGASIGLQLFGVTTAVVNGNRIITADGGDGGRGGLGGRGGRGGQGGAGAAGSLGGGNGGAGGAGGDGGFGGYGGAGGGGPSYGVLLGSGVGPTLSGNTIEVGDGGTGGDSQTGSASNAGNGGWSYGVFDTDTSDGIAPVLDANEIIVGVAGADGAPSSGTGSAGEVNP
jgi:hypothetical protein